MGLLDLRGFPVTAVLSLVFVLIPLALAARGIWAVWRFARLTPAAKRHYPRALLCKAQWRWLAANAQLGYLDHQRRRTLSPPTFTSVRVRTGKRPDDKARFRYPRAKFRATPTGIEARIRTVPGVTRADLEKALPTIADSWRVERCSISQPRAGRCVIKGHRTDPLLEVFGPAAVPSGVYDGRNLTRPYVGRDEHGTHRWMQVKDNTAATIAGQPGSGKSVGINGLLLQWAPSPACQFGTADGKSPMDGGDYEVWRPRAWRTCSDSREDVADMLSDACKVMRERLGFVAEITGSRNAWHRGPTPDFPLFALILDECQRYLDATAARRDKDLEKLILHIHQMAGDIVRQGRSVLMFLILATQRATVDSIPGQIRDNAALSLALSQKTVDASVAALGSSIRDYPSFMPTTMQDPVYTGCAVATMRTGQDPFTRLRMPSVTYADLKACATGTAHLRKDPAALLTASLDREPETADAS